MSESVLEYLEKSESQHIGFDRGQEPLRSHRSAKDFLEDAYQEIFSSEEVVIVDADFERQHTSKGALQQTSKRRSIPIDPMEREESKIPFHELKISNGTINSMIDRLEGMKPVEISYYCSGRNLEILIDEKPELVVEDVLKQVSNYSKHWLRIPREGGQLFRLMTHLWPKSQSRYTVNISTERGKDLCKRIVEYFENKGDVNQLNDFYNRLAETSRSRFIRYLEIAYTGWGTISLAMCFDDVSIPEHKEETRAFFGEMNLRSLRRRLGVKNSVYGRL